MYSWEYSIHIKNNNHSFQLPSVLQRTAKEQKNKGFFEDASKENSPFSSTSCYKWVAIFVDALIVAYSIVRSSILVLCVTCIAQWNRYNKGRRQFLLLSLQLAPQPHPPSPSADTLVMAASLSSLFSHRGSEKLCL
jgi:hypothetical protein